MEEIRMMRPRVEQVREIVRRAPVRLVFGTAGKATVILLPVSWADAVASVCPASGAIGVGRLDVNEAFAVTLLKCQVDANWKPWAYGVLFIKDEIAGYLVPDSPPWRAVVEGDNGAH